ncbi:hypothetical protein [Crocinitomix catalasitica]|uniref:hypothetical protein n=1 Tax=Crocinitomix catalasitica TaxID=184607 RepID=UPI0004802D30|nr:hypothetical protein [Crocinitomix catalasitica]
MQYLKKYAAIFVLLSTFLVVRFVAESFILESDDEMYSYIPQDADIVVEINTPNFIGELMNQRVFNEEYFFTRISPSDSDKDFSEAYSNAGINIFSKIVLFREAWALQNIWIGIFEFENKSKFENFLEEYLPESTVVFGKSHAIVQITPITNTDLNIDAHLEGLKNQTLKNIIDRIDIASNFKSENEINFYVSPKVNERNPIDEGFFALNFLKDEILLTGTLTKAANSYNFPFINYNINNNAAFSLRSSLNTSNGLNFFNSENTDVLPAYNQLAVDYDGIQIDLCDRSNGLPFKCYPSLQVQIDINDQLIWENYINDLQIRKLVLLDPENRTINTAIGAELNYLLNAKELRLSSLSIDSTFVKSDSNKTYIALNINVENLVKKTSFGVDQENPPSKLESTFGLAFANDMLSTIYKTTNISRINFVMKEKDDLIIDAIGRISMTNTTGNSILESLYFMQTSGEMLSGF